MPRCVLAQNTPTGVLSDAACSLDGRVQDQEKGNAAKRMAEIDETLEKLVAVAKKKGFIDPECTVQSLKEDAAKKKSEDDQGDAVGLMTTMKQDLDKQTSAVRLSDSMCGRFFAIIRFSWCVTGLHDGSTATRCPQHKLPH